MLYGLRDNAYDKSIFKLVYDGEQYDLSDVSEGTLKGLILNLLINMPMEKPKTLLAIDEPETNLHPAWQKVVGNWIQTADTFYQCFISTHSPDFLDVFTENHGRTDSMFFDMRLYRSWQAVAEKCRKYFEIRYAEL